ncbi:hypothetical protein DRQ50_13815 [bacterium]|nr:MAG: hypothetical protein DRQ50_13815 [bacterium]
MPRSTTLPIICLIGLCLLAGAHALMYWSWLEDDAFISFRYARNFNDGHGLVYNQGERVEGYSNFTWVMVAAAGLAAGTDPADLARVLGLAGVVLVSLLTWRLAARLAPGRRWTPLVAPLVLALSPAWVRHATNGLETTFAALLLLLLVDLVRPGAGRGRQLATALTAVVLAMSRPEGGVLAALVLMAATLADRGGKPYTGNRRMTWLLFLAGWGIYWTLRGLWFGSIMPNTYYAKMTGTAGGLVDGAQYVAGFLRDGGVILLLVLAAVAILHRTDRRPFAAILAAATACLAFAALSGGDWMVHGRFCAPALPLLAVLAATGTGDLLDSAPTAVRRRALAGTLAGLALLNWLGVADIERGVWREIAPAIEANEYRVEVYRTVGQWLAGQAPPGTLVAASDIGALGYWSRLPVLDMFGLVDPHVARRPGKQHHKSDAEYVLERAPGYVVLIRDLGSDDSYRRIPDQRLARHPEFARQYGLRHVLPMPYHGEEILIYERRSTEPLQPPGNAVTDPEATGPAPSAPDLAATGPANNPR